MVRGGSANLSAKAVSSLIKENHSARYFFRSFRWVHWSVFQLRVVGLVLIQAVLPT